SEAELNLIKEKCKLFGVEAVLSRGWALGGEGTTDLAKAVVEIVEKGENRYQPLYNWSLSIEEKIRIIATEIYGADEVQYSTQAKAQLKEYQKLGFDKLPI